MKKGSQKKVKIAPLGDRVLIKPLSEEEMGVVSPSGIIIPDTVDREKTDRGTVIAVGKGKYVGDDLVSLEVKEGDVVLFQWGEKVEIDGDEYYIVSESSVLAILEK